MKVLHVITGLEVGGAETALCRMLESLRAPHHEHIVVALGNPGALSSRVKSLALLYHLGMNPARPSVSALFRLRRVVIATAPDVVHGWMYHANLAAALATASMGIPLIWGIRHSINNLAEEKRLTRLVIKGGMLLSRRPNYILYNSGVSARQHEAFGYAASRTHLIPNGFDTSIFAPDTSLRQQIRGELMIPSSALVIGLVARVHPVKDHANFFRAAEIFLNEFPHAVFVVVGGGANDGNITLSSLIRECRLHGRVRLCGRRTDISAINSAFDIATSSSRSEAFPNVVGEAMACAVPCVATDVGDTHEIIGDTGVVVPARDAAALAEGWAKLARLGLRGRHALGLQARQRIIDRFSLDAVSRQYADLYESLLRKN